MTVLILAPHADDEVFGVGGTIVRAIENGRRVVVVVLTGHGKDKHPLWPRETWERIRGEARTAACILGVSELLFQDLPAACLDHTSSWEINRVVEGVIQDVQPDELYVPFAHDLHQDHQAIAYAGMVASRPYLPLGQKVRRVLAYETLSETHLDAPYMSPAFQPNVFVDISTQLETKLVAAQAYSSQLQSCTQPRSIAGLRTLAHMRGTHIGVAAAEAFLLLRETVR